MKKSLIPPAFKDTDEYVDFAMKHKVYGSEAVKLKQRMDKLKLIPEPKIK